MPERLAVTAEEIMVRDVPTLPSHAAITEALELLADEAIACVVILDNSQRPLGIVTERDLLALAEEDKEARLARVLKRLLLEEHHIFDTMRGLREFGGTKVGDVASSPVKCAEADMTVGQVARIMETFDYRQLPVTKDGKLVGLIGRQEIVRAIADRD